MNYLIEFRQHNELKNENPIQFVASTTNEFKEGTADGGRWLLDQKKKCAAQMELKERDLIIVKVIKLS